MGSTRSNDAYSFVAGNVGRTDTHNGLNQIVTAGGITLSHDARGNLTHDGVRSFTYSSENRLTGASGGASLAYDPLGRLYFAGISASLTYLGYEGERQIAEYDSWAGVLRRYVHGPGVDEPLVWYEGSGTGDRRFLHADERGSIVAVSDGAGNVTAINKYDEYGVPQGPSGAGTLFGRFGYTGQAWLPEIKLYYYKARMYWPGGGRFLQADPLGYYDSMNRYGYVGGDPVNFTDPSGMERKGCNEAGVNACKPIDPRAGTGTLIGGRECSSCMIAPPPWSSGGGQSSRGGGGSVRICTNCGQPAQSGPNGSIIVTGPHYVTIPVGAITSFVVGFTPVGVLADIGTLLTGRIS